MELIFICRSPSAGTPECKWVYSQVARRLMCTSPIKVRFKVKARGATLKLSELVDHAALILVQCCTVFISKICESQAQQRYRDDPMLLFHRARVQGSSLIKRRRFFFFFLFRLTNGFYSHNNLEKKGNIFSIFFFFLKRTQLCWWLLMHCICCCSSPELSLCAFK